MTEGAGTGGPSVVDRRIERLETEHRDLRSHVAGLHSELSEFRSSQAATNAVLQRTVDEQSGLLRTIDQKLERKTEPKPFPWPAIAVIIVTTTSMFLGTYYFTVEQFRADVDEVRQDTLENREDLEHWRDTSNDRLFDIAETAVRTEERLKALAEFNSELRQGND